MANIHPEGVQHWTIINLEKLLSNDQKPPISHQWISRELEKGDRIWCECQQDKYYYDASVKEIRGAQENRKFRITFLGMSSNHDQTFNFDDACTSFLPFNLQTANFVKAFNAKRFNMMRKKVEKTGAIFEESYDPRGSAYLQKVCKLDRAMIQRNSHVLYPPRRSVAELLHVFSVERTCFSKVKPYTADNFLAGFKTKIAENNFKNELFINDAETQEAEEYCTKLKEDLSLETIDFRYHFGIVHLLRYLSYLYKALKDAEKTDEQKRIYFLIHEMGQFFAISPKNLYNIKKDYV